MGRNADKMILVFSWRENGACFYPSYETKIDRFGGKGFLVRKMLGSHTPLNVSDAGTINSQRYREILEAYLRLFGPGLQFYRR
ncbi:hypothetical protein TNCV_2878431 [Trichonephila clavipes]|uniref:Uncharacterized protein n=1 Tax=Trichonephila clavipes TaxID=2585209 RepID=A0A8X6W1E4_TRICX|nr:hypothetical protein TNCV_2878431 [Trichonephila clavipes]